MHLNSILALNKALNQYFKIEGREFSMKNSEHRFEEKTFDNFGDYFKTLLEHGLQQRLGFIEQSVRLKEITDKLIEVGNPLLFFIDIESRYDLLLIHYDHKLRLVYKRIHGINGIVVNIEESDFIKLQPNLVTVGGLEDKNYFPLNRKNTALDKAKIFTLTVFRINPMLSEDPMLSDGKVENVLKPHQRLFRYLLSEKKDISYVYIYGILVGIISLSLPLGIQAIVSFISGGVIFNSATLLITIVILGFLVSGALQIMQLVMVEMLQRRIFARAAFEFTEKIPRMKIENLRNLYPPELMNRFFDILTIQKSLPKLLIDFTTQVLQIFFGIILLSFYHPFFLFFGVVLVIILILIFRFMGPKGIEANLKVSKYKYALVFWLQEMARNLGTFKMLGFNNFALDKTDVYLNNYLFARKKYFGVLLTQYVSVIVFKTLIIGALLIVGSILVVDRQITLGQFVASEVVILLIMSSVEKLIMSLETVYEAMTGAEKVGHVTDLPEDAHQGLNLRLGEGPINLEVKQLSYKIPGTTKYAIKDITFDAKPGERVAIASYPMAGVETLSSILTGLYFEYEGKVVYNNISLNDINVRFLHDRIASNIISNQIFEGTIEENIAMGRPQINYTKLVEVLKGSKLWDYVNSQKNSIQTQISAAGAKLPLSVFDKIILARSIASDPGLLLFNDKFPGLSSAKDEIIQYLTAKERPWTLIAFTNDRRFWERADKIFVIKDGSFIFSGDYQTFLNDPCYKILKNY